MGGVTWDQFPIQDAPIAGRGSRSKPDQEINHVRGSSAPTAPTYSHSSADGRWNRETHSGGTIRDWSTLRGDTGVHVGPPGRKPAFK